MPASTTKQQNNKDHSSSRENKLQFQWAICLEYIFAWNIKGNVSLLSVTHSSSYKRYIVSIITINSFAKHLKFGI